MLTRCGILAACSILFAAVASAQTFEPNVSRGGGDYRSLDLPTPDARLCQKTCIDEVVCLAWTYEAPQGTPAKPGKCSLKYTIPAATRNTCCTSGVVRSAAGMKIAHAKEAFEKRGLLGTFSQSCKEPVSATNQYIVYRAIDGERIQRDTMNSPTERDSVSVGEVATEPGPNRLQVDGIYETFRISYTLLLDGKRWRVLQRSWDDGAKSVVDGLFTSGRWKGTETP
jgi:PAN domain